MKTLELNQMEEINGGSFWKCLAKIVVASVAGGIGGGPLAAAFAGTAAAAGC